MPPHDQRYLQALKVCGFTTRVTDLLAHSNAGLVQRTSNWAGGGKGGPSSDELSPLLDVMSTEPDDMLSSPAADVSTDGSSCASTLMPDSRTACTSHLPAVAAVRVCHVFGRADTVHAGFSG